MEYLKPTSRGARYTHDYFVVPKSCNVCGYPFDADSRWRKSWCMAEKQAFKTEMSDKHRRCYQITKYLTNISKSWCLAEIQALKTEMSEKHRRCFQIVKYLAKDVKYIRENKYLLKNVVLQHSTTCSDTSDNYVDCVIKVYQDIGNAYNRWAFLSYHSNINILSTTGLIDCKKYEAYYQEFLTQLHSVSETDTFDSYVTRLWSRSESAAHDAMYHSLS